MPGSTNSVLRYRWARAAPTVRGIALARHASRGSAAVRPSPFPLCVAVVRSGNPASRRRPGVNVCRQVAHQIPETVKHRPLARPPILLERARRDPEPFGGLGRGEKHRCVSHVILLVRERPGHPATHVLRSNGKWRRPGRVVLAISKTTPPGADGRAPRFAADVTAPPPGPGSRPPSDCEPSFPAGARASASSCPRSSSPPPASRRRDPPRSRARTCPTLTSVKHRSEWFPVRGVRRIGSRTARRA